MACGSVPNQCTYRIGGFGSIIVILNKHALLNKCIASNLRFKFTTAQNMIRLVRNYILSDVNIRLNNLVIYCLLSVGGAGRGEGDEL